MGNDRNKRHEARIRSCYHKSAKLYFGLGLTLQLLVLVLALVLFLLWMIFLSVCQLEEGFEMHGLVPHKKTNDPDPVEVACSGKCHFLNAISLISHLSCLMCKSDYNMKPSYMEIP